MSTFYRCSCWTFSYYTLYNIYYNHDENSYISIIFYSTNDDGNKVNNFLKIIYIFTFNSRAFRKACHAIIESERALYNLETFYPTLTVDEIENIADRTCTICREDMQIEQRIKRLPCQHVFHDNCLYSWFQRQQTCMLTAKRFSLYIEQQYYRSYLSNYCFTVYASTTSTYAATNTSTSTCAFCWRYFTTTTLIFFSFNYSTVTTKYECWNIADIS